jgi:alpha-tubulin suppressor-like RCC1 family protein
VGDGGTMNALSPKPVPGLSSVVEIAAGGQHTCARLQSGVVQCWGANAFGQLGNGNSSQSSTPVTVKW